MVAVDAAPGRGVVIARIQPDAVIFTQRLVVENFRLCAVGRLHRDLQTGLPDDGAAVVKEADGLDIAAGAQHALRHDQTIGNAVMHVEKRAVHARHEHQVVVVQIRRGLLHAAAPVERVSVGDDGLDRLVHSIIQHVFAHGLCLFAAPALREHAALQRHAARQRQLPGEDGLRIIRRPHHAEQQAQAQRQRRKSAEIFLHMYTSFAKRFLPVC